MRVLSVRQPFAGLIISGKKKIEYRRWSTNYRGALLIHAGLAKARGVKGSETEQFPKGGIVGIAELVDCVALEGGGYGFKLRDARPLKFIPSKGRLRLYAPDAALLRKVGPIGPKR
jgi:hypothetical protein